jgi:hypothetical protein
MKKQVQMRFQQERAASAARVQAVQSQWDAEAIALEDKLEEIAPLIRDFLDRKVAALPSLAA